MPRQYSRIPIAARLWPKVDKSGGPAACWPSTGAVNNKGYGVIWDGDKVILAHRAAWELTHGPIPPGMVLCHHCDNPACCNPAHQFLGSKLDNSRDMVAKDRSARGERRPQARLTESDVVAIRAAYTGEASLDELAERYGVSRYTIRSAAKRQSWKHVA